MFENLKRFFFEPLHALLNDLFYRPTYLVIANRYRYPYFNFARLNRLFADLFLSRMALLWIALAILSYLDPFIGYLVLFLLSLHAYYFVCHVFMFFPHNRCGFVKRTAWVRTKDGKGYKTTIWQPRYTVNANESAYPNKFKTSSKMVTGYMS